MAVKDPANTYAYDFYKKMAPKAIAKNIFAADWREYSALLTGALYVEDQTGALVGVPIPTTQDDAARAGINFESLAGAALDGPLLRDQSYGSRLPRAEGTLYVQGPNARYNNLAGAADLKRLRDDLLRALDVRDDKHDKYDKLTVAASADVTAIAGATRIPLRPSRRSHRRRVRQHRAGTCCASVRSLCRQVVRRRSTTRTTRTKPRWPRAGAPSDHPSQAGGSRTAHSARRRGHPRTAP